MVLGVVASLPVHGQQYVEVSAVITQTNFTSAKSARDHWSFPVTCIVGTNEWRMDNRYTLNGEEAWYYDGTNVYHSLKALPDSRQDTNSVQSGDGNVTITIDPSPGGNPLGNPGANIPWLAFCSGSYLKQAGRSVPLPVVVVHDNPDSLAYVDKTETFNDAFGLPEQVELFTSRTQYFNSLYDERLYRNKRLLDARFNHTFQSADGVLRFRYVVYASTNFNNWNFPIEFGYFDYRPGSHGVGGEWVLFAAGVGRISSIRVAGKPQNVFASTPMQQTIVDNRFRHKTKLLDSLIYTWSNTTVPPANDPDLQARFAAKSLSVGVEYRPSLPRVRFILFSVVLLPMGCFACKVFCKKLKSKTNQ